MPLVRYNPVADTPSTTSPLPEAIQEPNKSIFTPLVPETKLNSLLKYVEGYPYTCNYYGQLINDNNVLEHYDTSTPDFTQPYYLVKDLVLQVQSPLTSSYNENDGITSVTGSALFPYQITPNAGDVIVMNLDTNEDALFIITTVSRKTYRKDTIYEVNYSLFAYTSTNTDSLVSLNNRVQQTYYFNKDTNFFNRDLLIKPSVKEAIDRLKKFMHVSKDHYFNNYVQKINGTIYIPGTDFNFFDPYLIDFLTTTVDSDNINFRRLTTINMSHSTIHKKYTLFNSIQSRDVDLLPVIEKELMFLPNTVFSNRGRFGSPYFVGVDYTLSPKNIDDTLNISGDDRYPSPYTIVNAPLTNKNYLNRFNKNIATLNGNVLLLHELFDKDYYLVSENFYLSNQAMSYFEMTLQKFIRREAIAKEDLAILIETWNMWSHLDKLYLLPICWHIINNT